MKKLLAWSKNPYDVTVRCRKCYKKIIIDGSYTNCFHGKELTHLKKIELFLKEITKNWLENHECFSKIRKFERNRYGN